MKELQNCDVTYSAESCGQQLDRPLSDQILKAWHLSCKVKLPRLAL